MKKSEPIGEYINASRSNAQPISIETDAPSQWSFPCSSPVVTRRMSSLSEERASQRLVSSSSRGCSLRAYPSQRTAVTIYSFKREGRQGRLFAATMDPSRVKVALKQIRPGPSIYAEYEAYNALERTFSPGQYPPFILRVLHPPLSVFRHIYVTDCMYKELWHPFPQRSSSTGRTHSLGTNAHEVPPMSLGSVLTRETPHSLWLALEWCQSDLWDEISRQEGHKLDYKVARKCFGEVSYAVYDSHHRARVAHGDIKAENILIGEDGHIRLSDWGSALVFDHSILPKSNNEKGEEKKLLRSYTAPRGTPTFLSPEATMRFPWAHVPRLVTSAYVVEDPLELCGIAWFPFANDMWSLGVLLYVLVSGCYPFYVASAQDPRFRSFLHVTGQWDAYKELYKYQLLRGTTPSLTRRQCEILEEYQYTDFKRGDEVEATRFVWPGEMNQTCRECVRSLLTVCPHERWTARDLVQCTWVQDSFSSNHVDESKTSPRSRRRSSAMEKALPETDHKQLFLHYPGEDQHYLKDHDYPAIFRDQKDDILLTRCITKRNYAGKRHRRRNRSLLLYDAYCSFWRPWCSWSSVAFRPRSFSTPARIQSPPAWTSPIQDENIGSLWWIFPHGTC